MSLRQAINAKCKDCTYDPVAPGTWRQQVTLCSVTVCPLWPVRPKTDAHIPESVLRFYGVDSAEFQKIQSNQREIPDEPQFTCESAKSVDSQAHNGNSSKEA